VPSAAGAEELLSRVAELVRDIGPPVTALSGGVDSSVVAVVADRVHGSRALAVTGVSPSLAPSELEAVTELARGLGLRHRLLETGEMELPAYRENGPDRCYHCKSDLFSRLLELARDEGCEAVLSGENKDDLGDYRPGMQAGAEMGVRRPLLEAGLDKAQVRLLAAHLGLPNHDKPAAPCLASRVPHGVTVQPDILSRIADAEARLRVLGFEVLRVRHHGDLARVEVPDGDIARVVESREAVAEAVRGAGYLWVSVDLAGFRSGSLNDALTTAPSRAEESKE
jgi:pyridinium-3,5-biscarboxylic acid mononucleotide sulfurtransferase